jgi:hypothetical protein
MTLGEELEKLEYDVSDLILKFIENKDITIDDIKLNPISIDGFGRVRSKTLGVKIEISSNLRRYEAN